MQDVPLIGAIKIIAWISNAEGLPHPVESVVRIRLHWPSCSGRVSPCASRSKATLRSPSSELPPSWTNIGQPVPQRLRIPPEGPPAERLALMDASWPFPGQCLAAWNSPRLVGACVRFVASLKRDNAYERH